VVLPCVADEASADISHHVTTLPIVPNYISNPPFPYAPSSSDCFQPSEVAAAVPSSRAAGECG